MPFVQIRGHYHVQGYKPDGDSVRFQAEDESAWEQLDDRVELNAQGHARRRLEAIDTLETHYAGQHQPIGLAQSALDFLLHELNVRAARFDALMLNVAEAEDGTPGYVVARETERNERPAAFAFAGQLPGADGQVFLTAQMLRGSLNFRSLAEGLAYPTYYKGLFQDLGAELTKAAAQARAAGLGIWAVDQTSQGFAVEDVTDITERHVILPKLFRRLVDFLRGGGSVARFKRFLEAKREPITILSTGHFTHFDTVVDVQGWTVRLTEHPENLVFNS